MKLYECPGCGQRVYFENLSCLGCGVALGYVPATDAMVSIDAAQAAGGHQSCANRSTLLCNWVVAPPPADAAATTPLCDCCRYTRTLPPLDQADNQQALARLEQAKRYLFYSLHALRLSIPDRVQQPQTGLAFDFLSQLANAPKVFTGHDSGIVTVNIAEADDARREQRRVSLHESYRTVLGHLRHEIGHFYWDQLLSNSELLPEFRKLFGDERQDYAAALQSHYQGTDNGNWQGEYISYYASSHPWEDWAETWAHYLHINDALDTAIAWRVSLAVDGASLHVRAPGVDMDVTEFCSCLITDWLPLSQYLNAACRSLGESDAYPFTMPPPVIEKLGFIHRVLRAQRTDKNSAVNPALAEESEQSHIAKRSPMVPVAAT